MRIQPLYRHCERQATVLSSQGPSDSHKLSTCLRCSRPKWSRRFTAFL